jgi:ABC-type phosphate/phosphonate transport system substrate-binding protein
MKLPYILFVWFSLLSVLRGQDVARGGPLELFRIGISYASFGTVSRNDASAALKAWATTLIKERNLRVNAQVEVYERESDLRDALAHSQVEAVSMTATEFIASGQQPDNIFVVARDKSVAEEYAVIVRRGDRVTDLAALKGRKLVRHLSPLTGPSSPWLDAVLARQSLGNAEKFFGSVTTLESPSKSVSQVFFHQADACLVTSKAFAVACEMNPQLQKDLDMLITSPPLIPSLFFFRLDYKSPARQEFEAAVLALHTTSAGQQVLTIFQGSRFEKQSLSCFDGTRELLTEYQRLSRVQGEDSADSRTSSMP